MVFAAEKKKKKKRPQIRDREEDILLGVFSHRFTVNGRERRSHREKLQKDDLHIFTQLDISNVTSEV